MQLYLKKWRLSAAAHLGESGLALLTEPQTYKKNDSVFCSMTQTVVISIDMEGTKLIKIKH